MPYPLGHWALSDDVLPLICNMTSSGFWCSKNYTLVSQRQVRFRLWVELHWIFGALPNISFSTRGPGFKSQTSPAVSEEEHAAASWLHPFAALSQTQNWSEIFTSAWVHLYFNDKRFLLKLVPAHPVRSQRSVTGQAYASSPLFSRSGSLV